MEIWPDIVFSKLMENRLGACRYTEEAFLQGYIVLNDLENGTENKLTEFADQVAWVWWG